MYYLWMWNEDTQQYFVYDKNRDLEKLCLKKSCIENKSVVKYGSKGIVDLIILGW